MITERKETFEYNSDGLTVNVTVLFTDSINGELIQSRTSTRYNIPIEVYKAEKEIARDAQQKEVDKNINDLAEINKIINNIGE